jgi:hypothetical protein
MAYAASPGAAQAIIPQRTLGGSEARRQRALGALASQEERMKQKKGAAKIQYRAAAAARQAQSTRAEPLIREGSPEFEAARREAIKRVVAKYAYTAQHEGIVLRNNPLKLAPYRDFRVQPYLARRVQLSLSRQQRQAPGLLSIF